MSHKLNLEVTAEDIETHAKHAMLKRRGCDEMQGYLLGRPMSAHLVASFVLDHVDIDRISPMLLLAIEP